jgi:putative endonuclease
MNKRAVGTAFEQKAADYLSLQGYQIIHRNFRCKIGEIDLIANMDGYLCFIEVKFRTDISKGYPSEAITPNKIRRITKTAEFYMLVQNLPQDTPCRFDVVVILEEDIQLIKNAFGGM